MQKLRESHVYIYEKYFIIKNGKQHQDFLKAFPNSSYECFKTVADRYWHNSSNLDKDAFCCGNLVVHDWKACRMNQRLDDVMKENGVTQGFMTEEEFDRWVATVDV
jgi:hypothetical protein